MLHQVMQPRELKDAALLSSLINNYVEVGVLVGVSSVIPGTIRTEAVE